MKIIIKLRKKTLKVGFGWVIFGHSAGSMVHDREFTLHFQALKCLNHHKNIVTLINDYLKKC